MFTDICKLLLIVIALISLGATAYAKDYYGGNGDWERNDTFGDMNVSTFVYIDVNRNGRYDLQDRPMSGIYSQLVSGNVLIHDAVSNINGFANFQSSRFKRNAKLKEPGEYAFRILPPPGWVISSNNAHQRVTLKHVFGSPAGVGLEEMPHPVGLMPILYITGTSKEPKSRVELTNQRTGEKKTALSDANGLFTFTELDPGDYTLTSSDASHRVSLASYPLHVGQLSHKRTKKKANQVATFDDISLSGLRKVPNGYAGVNWFNLNAMNDRFTTDSVGYINGAISPNDIAYTSSGHPAEIYSDTPFTLHEMAISVSWLRAEGETATIELFSGDKKIAEDTLILSAYGPLIYQPQMDGITKLRISTQHYWQAVLEDVTMTVKD